jgi:lipopolysaccharide transport system permease protein
MLAKPEPVRIAATSAGAAAEPSASAPRPVPEPESAVDPRADEWELVPRTASIAGAIAEAWRYRRLVPFFGARAVEKMYARTVLGRLWLFLRPLFPIFVGAIVFGGLLRVDSDGRPYFLFYLVGSTLWSWFDGSLTWATRSLELNRKVLRRLYVPRLLLPVAMTAPALVELGIRAGLIAIVATYYALAEQTRLAPSAWMPFALVPLVVTYALALGVGLFTSVIGMSARDVRFALGYVLGFAMFLSPVVYPLDVVPADHRWIAALNPMAGLLEAFRFCLLGTGAFEITAILYAAVVASVLLALGLRFFVRAEAAALDRS